MLQSSIESGNLKLGSYLDTLKFEITENHFFLNIGLVTMKRTLIEKLNQKKRSINQNPNELMKERKPCVERMKEYWGGSNNKKTSSKSNIVY